MKRRKLDNVNETESFKEGFLLFLRHCTVKNLTPATLQYYKDCYEGFVRYVGEDVSCRAINRELVEDYQMHLRERQLADATVNSNLKGLRAILYWMMKRNMMQPFSVHLMKQDEVMKETFTDEEMKALLKKPTMKHCDFSTYRNWVMINFLLGTGVRASTLINVQIEDLELSESCFKVRHNKNRKAQIIPLSSSLVRVLTEYLEYRPYKSAEEILFINVYGQAMSVSGVRQAMMKYGKRCGVHQCNPHKFRHTFAKNWVLAQGDIFRLQKILGHSSLDVVRKYVNLYGAEIARDFDKFSVLERLSTHREMVKLNKDE